MRIIEERNNDILFYSNFVKLTEEEKEEKRKSFEKILNEIGVKNIKDIRKS